MSISRFRPEGVIIEKWKFEAQFCMTMLKYEFLEHPADIKIRAFGKTMPEVFVNAVLGMMQYLFGKDTAKVDKIEHLTITGDDSETLLVNWLSEILALATINKCIYVAFNITEFTPHKIVASVGSSPAVAKEEIKAVTYHELQIVPCNDGWMATVVYDI